MCCLCGNVVRKGIDWKEEKKKNEKTDKMHNVTTMKVEARHIFMQLNVYGVLNEDPRKTNESPFNITSLKSAIH